MDFPFLFRFSFIFLEILYFVTTLWSQFPAIIILVTGTHQYFIHNTLGGSKESPLPRKNFKTARSFYFARFSLYICIQNKRNPCLQGFLKSKSTRRDSNPRPSPWQGDTPPLSHSCIFICKALSSEAGDGNRTHVSSLEG